MELKNQSANAAWKPKDGFLHNGMEIVRSTLSNNHVYLQGKNGDVYRLWLEFDGMPSIECIEYNAPLPKSDVEGV